MRKYIFAKEIFYLQGILDDINESVYLQGILDDINERTHLFLTVNTNTCRNAEPHLTKSESVYRMFTI